MARMRPKPNATPDDLAFGVNACSIALDQHLARALFYYADTRNRRVVDLADRARAEGIAVEAVATERLDQLTGEAVHQGVLVRLRNLPTAGLEEVAKRATESSLILLLDGITDPQNLGAVLRTSVAVGVDAIVLPPFGCHSNQGLRAEDLGGDQFRMPNRRATASA